MQALSIDIEGTVCLTDLDDSNVLRALYDCIGCSMVDVVRLQPDLDMWVDDEGLIVSDPQINKVATIIAHSLGYNAQAYCGKVVFTGGADEEGNTLPISEFRCAQITKWAHRIREMIDEHETKEDGS